MTAKTHTPRIHAVTHAEGNHTTLMLRLEVGGVAVAMVGRDLAVDPGDNISLERLETTAADLFEGVLAAVKDKAVLVVEEEG